MTRWVVFSDIDGTLLDADSYSFEAARPALAEIARRSVPLVLCTSKCAAEVIELQRRLDIRHPFISETGGAVAVPPGFFEVRPAGWEDRGDHLLRALSAGAAEILRGLARLREATGGAVRGFADMDDAEVARRTGLPARDAALARRREFDQPFVIAGDEAAIGSVVAKTAAALGLRISRGSRFRHLHGDCDKGGAVALLAGIYRERLGEIRTAGLGDSELDLPMLRAVDVPIAVLGSDGLHHPSLVVGVPGLRRVPFPGPVGWNAAILDVLA